MLESETTVQRGADREDTFAGRICRRLIDDPLRYSLWHGWHDTRMSTVAARVRRDLQIVELRAVHLEQVHRTALVRYFRKHAVTGEARDLTLRAFYGMADPRRATVAEHRTYVLSASSQVCAHRLLKLVGDHRGLALIQDYQGTFMQYFGMYCDDARAARTGSTFLLHNLIPEARAEADKLRQRILAGEGLPSKPFMGKPQVVPLQWRRANGANR